MGREDICTSHMPVYYSWPLKSMSLNCTGPLIHGFFSTVDVTLSYNPKSVKVMDMERRASYKLYPDIPLLIWLIALTPEFLKDQMYVYLLCVKAEKIFIQVLFSIPYTNIFYRKKYLILARCITEFPQLPALTPLLLLLCFWT